MANPQNKKLRTTYVADINELFKFAALMNAGGLSRNQMTNAENLLRKCVSAQKGVERREINNEEVAKFISKGISLQNE
jgi:hypothetical protein